MPTFYSRDSEDYYAHDLSVMVKLNSKAHRNSFGAPYRIAIKGKYFDFASSFMDDKVEVKRSSAMDIYACDAMCFLTALKALRPLLEHDGPEISVNMFGRYAFEDDTRAKLEIGTFPGHALRLYLGRDGAREDEEAYDAIGVNDCEVKVIIDALTWIVEHNDQEDHGTW